MRVPTRVGELYVEDLGKGPPVVLWHSFLHHGGMWRAQVEALVAHHRVINIDAPGHGRSARIDRSLDMSDCAFAATQVLDACGLDRVAWCGLSWGGMVGMTLAVEHPSRVSALVLMDTSCRAEPRKNRIEYHLLGTIFRNIGMAPFLLRKVEKLFFTDDTLRNDRAMVDEWAGYVARLDRDSTWKALHCIFDRRDLQETLSAVRTPTLVVCGELDKAQPVRESKAIAAALPGARLAIVPGAAHLSTVEQPRLVNDLLVPFLAEHAPKAAGAARDAVRSKIG
jgi:3-oxoadipate enol-lactonase